MANPKRHLIVRTSGLCACGVVRPKKMTVRPSDVTCVGCQRSVYMADAEVKQQVQTSEPKGTA